MTFFRLFVAYYKDHYSKLEGRRISFDSLLQTTMSQQEVDEETPLLQSAQQKKTRTPLPWRQFSIILFLQLAEPLTSQVISPFAPQVCSSTVDSLHTLTLLTQLIRDIGITNGDETRVGYYVGLMVSLIEQHTYLHPLICM